jgi:hypothetical protein
MRAPAEPVKDEAFRRMRGVNESVFTTPFYEIGKQKRLGGCPGAGAFQDKVKTLFP